MLTDDVCLIKLAEETRYETKRTIADKNLRNRILIAIEKYESITDADVNLAYDLAQDLNIIKTLVKMESDQLERKLTVFETKLNQLGNMILPKDEDDEDAFHVKQPKITTIFQNDVVRIIDIKNKESALAKMKEATALAAQAKEVIQLSKTPMLSADLRYEVNNLMTQLLELLKLDGAIALKMADEVEATKKAFIDTDERDNILNSKLKLIKLKLERCYKHVQDTQPVTEIFPKFYY